MRSQRLTVFTCLLVISCFAASTYSQSGRRQSKPAPAAPVPTPTPEPTPPPKKVEKEPEMLFLVGADTNSLDVTIPLVYYDAPVHGCADRLRAGSSAGIDVAERGLSRGDAIKKAKADSKTYVVLLSLSLDSMSRSYDDIQLDFVVFAPTTAKVVTTGRSYLNSNRAGPIIVGRPTRGGSIYREQMLRQAGEDAANRILKAMNLGVVVPR